MEFQEIIQLLGQLKDQKASQGVTNIINHALSSGFISIIDSCLSQSTDNGYLDEIIEILLRTDIDIKLYGELAMRNSCQIGSLNSVTRLMDAGFQFDPEVDNFYPVCHVNGGEIVKLFLKNKMEPEMSTLSTCCFKGLTEIIQIFLEAGIKFNQPCLRNACWNQQKEVVKTLLLDPSQDFDLDRAMETCQNDENGLEIRALIEAEKERRMKLVKSAAKN